MTCTNIHFLRKLVRPYLKRSNLKAILIFNSEYIVFLLTITGSLISENIYAAILFGVLAGFKMATLFVIAHDAAHDNYTTSSLLNKILSRLAFLPCLHNYSLWLIAHNQKHHLYTNIKGVNSWSPLSPQEYENLPIWKKRLYRFYRTPQGIGFYYLVERWWKEKFCPFISVTKLRCNSAVMDFVLLLTAMIGFILTIIFLNNSLESTRSIPLQLLISCVLPFMVFCYLVGFNVYQQHTHESIPWFRNRRERDNNVQIQELVMYMQYPAWFRLSCLNVMEHTVHHIDPRIPLYNLAIAQKKLQQTLHGDMPTAYFSWGDFLQTMKKCKLYDYDTNQWRNFDGYVTGITQASDNKLYALVA